MTTHNTGGSRSRARADSGGDLARAPGFDVPQSLPEATTSEHRDQYVEGLIEAGSSLLLPELEARPDAIYRVRDRGGLGVVAVAEGALGECQLEMLSRFRFAQYLAAGLLDRDVAFHRRLDHDSLTDRTAPANPDTVHIIAFASGDGRILASMCLFALSPVEPGVRVRSEERPLFPLEEHFGRGVFNRLAIVPDTPVGRVREFRRLVKNLRHGSSGVGPRAVIELCLAASRLLLTTLASTVDVCVGEFESNGVRRTLEFFHTPMVVLAGGLPALGPGHPLNAALDGRDRHPFAFLVSDLTSMTSRLDAIEGALDMPDAQAIAELAALKRIPYDTPSTLVPPGGVPALANTGFPQRSIDLPARRRARELGLRLRRFRAFAALSDTECIALRSLAIQADVKRGRTIVARGEIASELVLVEEGRAELRVRGRPHEPVAGPGDIIGAAGVLAGAATPGDVAAATPMRVLRLPADACVPLVRELPDVELELLHNALRELGSQTPPRASRIAANSAEAMAALRAAGAVEREPALRNPDYMARCFVTTQLRVHAMAKVPVVRRLIPVVAERLAPGAYHYETARVKHIDATLSGEVRAGLDQLVLLGAGYDSRPYRFAPALASVRVFEVDLPAILELKCRRVGRVLGRTPSLATFVPADLTRDDVCARLEEHSYDLTARTLIVLCGVAPYLPEPAVGRLFSFVARHTSPRTSIVFDYVYGEMVDGCDSFHGAAAARKRLAELGEPLRFGIPAGAVERYVESFGLTLVSELAAAELAGRYLRAGNGTVMGEPYGFAAIAHARVAS